MARLLCHNLIRTPAITVIRLLRPTLAVRFLCLRRCCDHTGTAQLVHLDIGDEGDAAAAATVIEEVVQSILVRRSTPDWLPFVPGASFWVPPRKSPRADGSVPGGFEEWVAVEEAPSYPSNHGWPSLTYFVEGKFLQPTMTSEETKMPSDDESS